MFCQSCGAELPDGARFCPQCGQNCSVQSKVPNENSFSFDDELSPIEKPTKAKAQTKATKSKSESAKKKAVEANHEKASIVGATEWRYWHENGSNNNLTEYFDDTLFSISFEHHGDSFDMPLMSNRGTIVPGTVGRFHIGKKTRKVFYLNEDYQLIACDLNGKNEILIAGGNGDRVVDFVLNDEYLFVIVQAKDDERSIFKISQSLDNSVVLKKGYRLRSLAAEQNYLYYIDGTVLTQYDLKSGAEKVILEREGIKTLQLYNGYLVLTISDNIFSTHDKDNCILLIDPSRMLQRVVAQVAAKSVNCYWDHVFYTDAKNEYIWTIPLTGGTAHLLRNRASDSLNAACGCLFFVDCASVQVSSISLRDGKEILPDEGKVPIAEAEAIRYSLLNQGAEHYKDYTLSQAILEGIEVLRMTNTKSELFNYVAFLTLPQLNKQDENVSALLNAAGYSPKKTSQAILFVDTTISHKRSKGFIVATDGIYSGNRFFPYDYTFDCSRAGTQNIRLTTYEGERFGKEKRTLDISCPMFKEGLEDLAELIYTVYAFSFFRTAAISDGYVLPLPKDLSGRKQPGYITAAKKKTAEEVPTAGNAKDSENHAELADSTQLQKDSETAENAPASAEFNAAKQKEYVTEMDQLWRSKPFKDIFTYNFVKVLLEFLFPLSLGIAIIFGVVIREILTLFLDNSVISTIIGVLAAIIGLAGAGFLGYHFVGICISLNEKISGTEGEAIHEKYASYGISDSYTPIGIRGTVNVIVTIACWFFALVLITNLGLGLGL